MKPGQTRGLNLCQIARPAVLVRGIVASSCPSLWNQAGLQIVVVIVIEVGSLSWVLVAVTIAHPASATASVVVGFCPWDRRYH